MWGHDAEEGAALNLSFFVEGIPVTQGSKRIVQPKGQRARMIDVKSTKLKAWRACIGWKARIAHKGEPVEGPVRLSLVFDMPRPKTPSNQYPRGDLDKYIRAALDAMTGVVYRDDSQVVRVLASKHYRADGVVGLTVSATDEMEAA